MYIYTHDHTCILFIQVHAQMHTYCYKKIHMHLYTYICLCVCICELYLYVRVSVHVQVYVHGWVHVQVCICVYMYSCMSVYMSCLKVSGTTFTSWRAQMFMGSCNSHVYAKIRRHSKRIKVSVLPALYQLCFSGVDFGEQSYRSSRRAWRKPHHGVRQAWP